MTNKLSRRKFIKASAAGAGAGAIAATGAFKARTAMAKDEIIKVGFCVDLTGDAAAWGLPGLYGADIWAEELNGRGGIKVGDKMLPVEIIPYDDQFDITKATVGVKKLLFEDEVDFMILLSSPPATAVQDILTRNEMISTVLSPADMSPDYPYLYAPVETHPFYNISGIDHIARTNPEMKTMSVITQNDYLGLVSLAMYRAAAEVAGIEIIEEKLFGFETIDFAPVVSGVIAKNPDILCWDTAYPDYVNLLTEQAFQQNYQGQIVTCTLDGYTQMLEKSSVAFMEGSIWQFPDFDDEAMQAEDINFAKPREFFNKYEERHPNAWNAVSWEYAAILEMWKDGIEAAGEYHPMAVFKALKAMSPVPHVFGDCEWWGTEMFGIDNIAMGNWPVVQMKNGKATIVAMTDYKSWIDEHLDLTISHFKALDVF